MSTKRTVMHWISTACVELGQDETASTQAWKHLQQVFGPTGPEILAAADAENEKELLFAPYTVTKEKELAEDAWEPAEQLLDDHDGEEEELGPQETVTTLSCKSRVQQAQQVLGPASLSG